MKGLLRDDVKIVASMTNDDVCCDDETASASLHVSLAQDLAVLVAVVEQVNTA